MTLDQCQTTCVDDKSCRAFTYNVKAKWCFLKSDYNQLNTFDGAVAGKVVTASAEPDIGAAPDLDLVEQETLDEAQRFPRSACRADGTAGPGLESLKALAQIDFLNNDPKAALNAYTAALAIQPDDASLWIEMARVANAIQKDDSVLPQAVSAAINGYQLSRTTQTRAEALYQLVWPSTGRPITAAASMR